MQRKPSERLLISLVSLALSGAAASAERRSGLTHTPEAVFDRPAAEIMPELAGASPTGDDGRVGGALAFWGYELADGRPVYFFACAEVRDMSCKERIESICPNGSTTVLGTREHTGRIVRRRCREIAIAHPGDAHPGCVDTETDSPLAIGLVTCG